MRINPLIGYGVAKKLVSYIGNNLIIVISLVDLELPWAADFQYSVW